MPFPPMNASTTVTGGRRVVAFDYEGVLNENVSCAHFTGSDKLFYEGVAGVGRAF